MDKLKFIKEALENDLAYWEREDVYDTFNNGAAAGLRSFKEKIKHILEEVETDEEN